MTPAIQYLPPGNASNTGSLISAGFHQKKIKSHNYHARNETEAEWRSPDPCVTFWRALFLQQAKDAQSNPRTGEEKRAKADAIKWLEGGKDFEMVCELADLSIEDTLKAIKEALIRGIQFRLPKGKGPRAKRRKGYNQ